MFEGWRSSPHPSPRILVGLLWFSWRLLLRPSGRPSQGSWVPPPTRVILSGVPPARHPLEPLPLLRRHLPSRPFCRSVEIKSVFPDVLGTRIGGLEASAWLPLGQIDADAARRLAETSVLPPNSHLHEAVPCRVPRTSSTDAGLRAPCAVARPARRHGRFSHAHARHRSQCAESDPHRYRGSIIVELRPSRGTETGGYMVDEIR